MRTRRLLPLLLVLPMLAAIRCSSVEFDLGVGAFEIGPRTAILWARAVPSSETQDKVHLQLRIARDPDFADVVLTAPATARRDHDFTTRAKVGGLEPHTEYYYRFHAGEQGQGSGQSAIGRFRTAPTEEMSDPVRFVVSGDSNIGHTRARGLDFYVLSAAVAEDPDFFVYFGDTIYADSGVLPGGANAFTLDEYREVHRLTRADPHLQALLAATGTFSGWDDHEVRNDYDGETVDPVQFDNGARAFFEYLPLRKTVGNAPWTTDRTVRWGEHVELFFLDGRQFRSAEFFCNPAPIPDGDETASTLFSPFPEDEVIAEPILGPIFPLAAPLLTPSDPDCVDGLLAQPDRTYLGADQMARLRADLLASDASFKIIVNNTPLSKLLFLPYDRWESYRAERDDFVAFLAANFSADELLILTTDFHTNLAIESPGFTELIVGPIATSTFGATVLALLPPELAFLADSVFTLLDLLIDEVNGLGSVLGSDADAYSYAVIDVFEEPDGTPRLLATVRGDGDYASGDNDPAKVSDLFSFELPRRFRHGVPPPLP